MKKQMYSLVWQQCGKNSVIAKRFYVPGYDKYLPFFLSGDDVLCLEKGQNVRLKEEQLLKGILYGLYEFELSGHPPPLVEIDKSTLLYLLDFLGNGFKFDNPESVILDTAGAVREINGSMASSIMLRTGINLIPQSSKIKSDLIMNLSELIKDTSYEHLHNQYCEDVLNLIPKIDFEDILSEAKEIVSYLGLEALMHLKWYDRVPAFLENYIYPNVKDRGLKIKIRDMLVEMDPAFGEDD